MGLTDRPNFRMSDRVWQEGRDRMAAAGQGIVWFTRTDVEASV